MEGPLIQPEYTEHPRRDTDGDESGVYFLCVYLFYCLFLVLKVAPKTTHTFKIPEIHFPLVRQCVQTYFMELEAQLSKAMGLLGPEQAMLHARYLYLRGLVHLRQGQLLAALLDFQSLYKTDVRIFPAELVKCTVESLPAATRAQAERMPELRRLICEVAEQPRDTTKADDRVKNFELPKKHLPLADFVKTVQESGIVKDAGIIHRLFEALTVGKAVGPTGQYLPGGRGALAVCLRH